MSWDWIGHTGKAETADITDGVWMRNPDAVYITGYYGEHHMDQFAGVGPSERQYKMKALLIDGVVYIPNPATRNTDSAATRQWIAAPVQPPTRCISHDIQPKYRGV